MEHFRGVVWPRGEADKQKHGVYRYAIVGMLVTDRPLENIDSKNQIVLDGHAAGMSDAIQTIQQKESSFQGDATSVLLSLNDIVD